MSNACSSSPAERSRSPSVLQCSDPSRPPRGPGLPELTMQLRPYFEAAGRQPNTFRQNYNLLLNGAFPARKWRGSWHSDLPAAEVAVLLGLVPNTPSAEGAPRALGHVAAYK